MAPSQRLDQDALLAILERQIAVITRQQALAVGLTRHALRHRLRAGGPWRSLLPGVYVAASGTPTSLQQEVAALLYAGPGTVITGLAAIRHHGIRGPVTEFVDVLVPASRRRRDAAFLRLHRTTRLPEPVADDRPLRAARRAGAGRPARPAALRPAAPRGRRYRRRPGQPPRRAGDRGRRGAA